MELIESQNVRVKEKLMVLSDADFEVLQLLYDYHYLTYDLIKNQYGLSDSNVKRRLSQLYKHEYITKHMTGSKKERTYQVIYGLGKGGFYSVTDYYTREKFDPESTLRLKKTYRHSLVAAQILFAHKIVKPEVEILSEKQAYHFYGKDKEYKNVLRPDGAIVRDNFCMFLEYENNQKSRSFRQKIKRYEYYAREHLIQHHPNIEARTFLVLFIFNTELKMNNAIEIIQKIDVASSSGLQIDAAILEEVLIAPFKREKIRSVIE